MEITTVGGLIVGVVCIIISILLSGSLGAYVDGPSIFVVIGGLIAATMISYPMKTLQGLGKSIAICFQTKDVDLTKDVEMIISVANVARREGILALEETVKDMDDAFLKKGIMLIIDGSDAELVRSIMEAEMSFIAERHGSWQSRSEEHTSELQSRSDIVCRLLLEIGRASCRERV